MSDSERTNESLPGPGRPPASHTSPFSDSQIDADATSVSDTTSPAASGGTVVSTGTMLGPYRLEKKLGEGGMGTVFKATHTHLEKAVAVKVLSTRVTSQGDFIARFKREMKAVGKLEHSNIIRAMDAGEIGGVHFLTMEYVEGADLARLVQTRGPLPPAEALDIVEQVAAALAAAHAVGLVHRDIKPSNLMLTTAGQVKVLDLGLARIGEELQAGTQLTGAGEVFGTPDYMAPEQWEDARLADRRTDLYALGCSLHYLLTGHAPFERYLGTPAKMTAHFRASIPVLPLADSRVSRDLNSIFERLLAKQPEDRFQSAAELTEAIASWKKCESRLKRTIASSSSNHDSRPSPSFLGLRRSVWVSSAGVAIAIALLAVAIAYWQADQTHLAEEAAEKATSSKLAEQPKAIASIRPAVEPNIPTPLRPPREEEASSPLLGVWRVYSQWLPHEGGRVEFFPTGKLRFEVQERSFGGPDSEKGVQLSFSSSPKNESGVSAVVVAASEIAGESAKEYFTPLRIRPSEDWELEFHDADHCSVKRKFMGADPSKPRIVDECMLFRMTVEPGPPILRREHQDLLGIWWVHPGQMGNTETIQFHLTKAGEFITTVAGKDFGGRNGLTEMRQWYRVEPSSTEKLLVITVETAPLKPGSNNLMLGPSESMQATETWTIDVQGQNGEHRLVRRISILETQTAEVREYPADKEVVLSRNKNPKPVVDEPKSAPLRKLDREKLGELGTEGILQQVAYNESALEKAPPSDVATIAECRLNLSDMHLRLAFMKSQTTFQEVRDLAAGKTPPQFSKAYHLELARQHAEELAQLDNRPSPEFAYVGLGNVHEDCAYYLSLAEHYPRAIDAFRQAILIARENDRDTAVAQLNLGRCLYRSLVDSRFASAEDVNRVGLVQEAIAHLEEASASLETKPRYKAEAFLWLAQCKRFRVNQRAQDAELKDNLEVTRLLLDEAIAHLSEAAQLAAKENDKSTQILYLSIQFESRLMAINLSKNELDTEKARSLNDQLEAVENAAFQICLANPPGMRPGHVGTFAKFAGLRISKSANALERNVLLRERWLNDPRMLPLWNSDATWKYEHFLVLLASVQEMDRAKTPGPELVGQLRQAEALISGLDDSTAKRARSHLADREAQRASERILAVKSATQAQFLAAYKTELLVFAQAKRSRDLVVAEDQELAQLFNRIDSTSPEDLSQLGNKLTSLEKRRLINELNRFTDPGVPMNIAVGYLLGFEQTQIERTFGGLTRLELARLARDTLRPYFVVAHEPAMSHYQPTLERLKNRLKAVEKFLQKPE
jgi:serine/threonine protein kinase/tetratricopeptide (TPR) repeat protein